MISVEDTPRTAKMGRPKGSMNASTIDARRAIADFVEGNVDRLTGWLDEIAETNPAAAFDRFMSVIEYHIPKLQRSEVKVEGEINHVLVNAARARFESMQNSQIIEQNTKLIPKPHDI